MPIEPSHRPLRRVKPFSPPPITYRVNAEEGEIERQASFSVKCSGVLWTFVITSTTLPIICPGSSLMSTHLGQQSKCYCANSWLIACPPGLCPRPKVVLLHSWDSPSLHHSLVLSGGCWVQGDLVSCGAWSRTAERANVRWEEVKSIVPQD